MQQEQRESPKQRTPLDDMRRGFNILLVIAFIWAVPVQVLMRKVGTVGGRYISPHFAIGIVWIVVFCSLVDPGQHPAPVIFFAILTASMTVLHWVKRDVKGHSQYCGDSGLGYGKSVYTLWEPLAFALAGWAVMASELSTALGFFMMGSGVASGFFHSHLDDRDRARIRTMNDAALEQRYSMELYRKEYE